MSSLLNMNSNTYVFIACTRNSTFTKWHGFCTNYRRFRIEFDPDISEATMVQQKCKNILQGSSAKNHESSYGEKYNLLSFMCGVRSCTPERGVFLENINLLCLFKALNFK